MKINKEKLELAMARACLNPQDLTKSSGLPAPTVNGAIRGRGIRPATLGRIAKALDCDPADIIEKEA